MPERRLGAGRIRQSVYRQKKNGVEKKKLSCMSLEVQQTEKLSRNVINSSFLLFLLGHYFKAMERWMEPGTLVPKTS
jgi:hypothetical protein